MPDVTVQDLIRQEAQKAGIPAELALAVAEQESGFNPTSIGKELPSGERAIGTFQILPSTAKTRGFDPNDPAANIRGGIGYLRELLDQNNGDLEQVLKTYGGVKTDTKYVPRVLALLSKHQGVAQTPPPAPAKPVTPPVDNRSYFQQAEEGFAKSATAAGMSIVGPLAERLKARFPNLFEKNPPPPLDTTPKTTAEKIGGFAEKAAEFSVGSELAGAAAAAARLPSLVRSAAQVGTAYGISKFQGASDVGAAVNAVTAGVAESLPLAAQALRNRAETQLARVFATGLENKGPMIDYALKTGDVADKTVQRAVDTVRRAASETLDLPVQLSWGKWMTGLTRDAAQKGETLGEALKGPLGSAEIPKQPIVDALNDLTATATKHFAEIPSGDFMEVTYNAPLAKEIGVLKDQLAKYGNTITVRNLVDIKRTWDSYVYTLSTAGKVGVTPETLIANASKEALFNGANAIRQVLDAEAPTIAALDKAVSHAYQLQDLVNKLYKVNPAMGSTGHAVAHAVGAAGGFAAGYTVGHPYMGLGLGASMGRFVARAMESPAWRTLSPSLKGRLANALATGDLDVARRILAPIVSANVSGLTRQPVEAR